MDIIVHASTEEKGTHYVRNPHWYGGYLFSTYSKLHHQTKFDNAIDNVCILYYKEACRAGSIENIKCALTTVVKSCICTSLIFW